jgi:hypothetical protein
VNIIDVLIGMTLMNAMPHFVLGVWKGRMLSAFGFGDTKNRIYGLVNCLLSVSLFGARYGLGGLFSNGIYAGALLLLIIYFLTGGFWYSTFHQKYFATRTGPSLPGGTT